MRGDEPQPRDRWDAVGGPDAVDRADELGEVRAAVEVDPPADLTRPVDVPEPRLGLGSWPYELTFWPSSVTSR